KTAEIDQAQVSKWLHRSQNAEIDQAHVSKLSHRSQNCRNRSSTGLKVASPVSKLQKSIKHTSQSGCTGLKTQKSIKHTSQSCRTGLKTAEIDQAQVSKWLHLSQNCRNRSSTRLKVAAPVSKLQKSIKHRSQSGCTGL